VTKLRITVGNLQLDVGQSSMEKYLTNLFKSPTKLIELRKLGEGFHNAGFLVVVRVEGRERRFVMRIVRGDTGWGHDYLGDRSAVLLLQHRLFNTCPEGTCCRSFDVAGIRGDGSIASVGDTVEFFNLVEEVKEAEGKSYVDDLFRIARTDNSTDNDIVRCRKAAEFLVKLHSMKMRNDILYKRHIRDLIGHGEMLMGVIDTYPDLRQLDFTTPEEIAEIEMKAVLWRNRIKHMGHRLCRIHGDYHPFGNIRFKPDNSMVALDLSREEYGEPADDISALTMNYLFVSVWQTGRLVDSLRRLTEVFFKTYMEKTDDEELLRVIAPFYAFRGFVVAHPLYYPELSSSQRRTIVNFIRNVLDSEVFNFKEIHVYLKDS